MGGVRAPLGVDDDLAVVAGLDDVRDELAVRDKPNLDEHAGQDRGYAADAQALDLVLHQPAIERLALEVVVERRHQVEGLHHVFEVLGAWWRRREAPGVGSR